MPESFLDVQELEVQYRTPEGTVCTANEVSFNSSDKSDFKRQGILMLPRFSRTIVVCVVSSALLTACQFTKPLPEPAASPTPPAESIPTEPVSTPASGPRTLTVCLGQEPNTFYPFDVQNSAARNILGTLYDGPIDEFANGYQTVILEKIPSIKNSDAQLAPVAPKRGDMVVDAAGDVVPLENGIIVLPAGCYTDACAVKYTDSLVLSMDQLVVTFRLLPDLKWSDGTPLTIKDSIYAFTLDAADSTPGSKYLIDRTQSYEALDNLTAQWWGLPGFVDPTYADNFWSPLPEHLWGNLSPAQLASADTTSRPPVGWGPYIFREWVPGELIRMEKNPNYFRAGEKLPLFDTLIFRFVKDAPTAISAMIAGQCDLLDPSVRLDGHIDLLTELQRDDQLRLVTSTTPVMERLDFGIRPAAYDKDPNSTSRPNYFGDVRTRQGIAYCLDREKVVSSVLTGMSQVPDTFISPANAMASTDTAKYSFNVSKGSELLKAAGWVDADNDPTTPRIALSVSGVPDGTPLALHYWTSSALQRQQVSKILADSLAQCGVGVTLEYFNQDEFYAPGPDGMLFGRKFDLAQYAVSASGAEPVCSWLLSDQIPDAANRWLGLNISAYDNPDFDLLCRQAMRTLPDQPEHQASFAQAQSIFANDLPFIPLYMRLKVAVTRRDLCNYRLDAFTLNDLWNIEELDYQPSCKQ